MPNGAKPASAGSGSVKPPAKVTLWKAVSKTSTVPARKLAAYRKLAVPLLASASPLYTGPLAAAQKGVVGPSARPHGLTRCGSTCAAGANPRLLSTAGSSVTRLVSEKEPVAAVLPSAVSVTVTCGVNVPGRA